MSELSLTAIVQALGGELHADSDLPIKGLASLEAATPSQLSFVSNPRYQQQLRHSQAACVIVGPQLKEEALLRGACIVTEQPYLYFAKVTQLWRKTLRAGAPQESRCH